MLTQNQMTYKIAYDKEAHVLSTASSNILSRHLVTLCILL